MNQKIDLKPNWESIGKPLKSSLKDAILLSLGVIPDWEIYAKNIPSKKHLEINFDYVHRLKLAIDWALEANFLVSLKRTKDISEIDEIYIPVFVNWVLEKQSWETPEEFRKLGSSKIKNNLKTISEKLDWKSEARIIGEKFLDDYGILGNGSDKSLTQISQFVAKALNEKGMLNKKGKEFKVESVRRDCLGGEWYQQMVQLKKVLQK